MMSVEGFGHLHGGAVEGDEHQAVVFTSTWAVRMGESAVRDCANKSMKRPPMRVL